MILLILNWFPGFKKGGTFEENAPLKVYILFCKLSLYFFWLLKSILIVKSFSHLDGEEKMG